MSAGVQARVAEAFRLEYGRVVASVLRIVRDIDTAEEVVQEAFAQALDRWPADGTAESLRALSGSCVPSGRSTIANFPTRCPKGPSCLRVYRPCSPWSI